MSLVLTFFFCLPSDLLRSSTDNQSMRDYYFYVAIAYTRLKVHMNIYSTQVYGYLPVKLIYVSFPHCHVTLSLSKCLSVCLFICLSFSLLFSLSSPLFVSECLCFLSLTHCLCHSLALFFQKLFQAFSPWDSNKIFEFHHMVTSVAFICFYMPLLRDWSMNVSDMMMIQMKLFPYLILMTDSKLSLFSKVALSINLNMSACEC